MGKKPISPARTGAIRVLEQVLTRGDTLLDALPGLDEHCSDPRDLALARDIVMGTCRRLGKIRHVLGHAAAKFDKFPHPVKRILEMSVYQLLFLDRVPAYAVISEAVELTRSRGMRNLTRPVNGILRTISRETGGFPAPAKEEGFVQYLSIEQSHPAWLIGEWLERWNEEDVEALCRYNNTQAPLSLRIRGSFEEAVRVLEQNGIAYERDERFSNRLSIPAEAAMGKEWLEKDGWVVQDGAAMLVAQVAGARPGQRIWDVCAAPGGKTFYLADVMKDEGMILATDKSEGRMQRLLARKEKLGLTCITCKAMDALQDRLLADTPPFDVILVDVPCTGWGTFRRHPDLRWRLTPDDSPRLGDMAFNLLEGVKGHLKPGGVLVYSTCTLSLRENGDVVTKFIYNNPDFVLDSVETFLPEAFQGTVSKDGWMEIFPPKWGLDGAFAARIRKRC
ncbi:16S rRNA (cytosine(967)-C(5))-methyltransferase RsmB [bacterium]|nr:16S rRNA (cytosine(967)-C(5))-methyltransferase RsmB [bacterium]